ncbi:hypothetical protein [Ferruginibacter sp.]|nr:hypothetical protein [Ferruginibacter sp.]
MIKELEDYSWFPQTLRRWQMEFIGSIAVWIKLYQPLAPVLQQIIKENKIIALQDLCSGSGIPAVYIHNALIPKIPMLLTDKFPDTSFVNKPGIAYSLHAVDVLEVATVQDTVYTMYNAFHHFSAAQQKELVQNMANKQATFLIAEILEPGLLNCIKIFFTTTFIQLLTAPLLQPFSFARLFFTYIVPVNLFTVTYDGIVSVLKSKTAKQYEQLLKNISSRSYTITVHTVNNWEGNLVYIKGVPTNK